MIKGKLNIFNWVYWRSIGLSFTSVCLLGNMSLLSILPNTSRHCSLLSLFMFTFTLIYFSTTLGCMCLFLSIGFTWIPSVYKLFSLGAPQLEGFSVSQSVSQSNCMVASMDWLHVLLYKRNRSVGCLKWLTRPLSPYQCCYCFFHLSSLYIASSTMVSGKELSRATGSATWANLMAPCGFPLYKWNIDP